MARLLINNIKIRLDDDESKVIDQAKKMIRLEGLKPNDFEYSIHKRSIDARDKSNILLVYTVLAASTKPISLKPSSKIKICENSTLSFEFGKEEMKNRPIIVGMGPAGMFCALILAEHGFNPIIIDRGDSVLDRTKALERFLQTGTLDLDSNVQFGAGGAGTFSDGKLTTRINDSRCNYVLSRFVEFGAPAEILTKAKPHIGTDILANVVDNILNRIEELGGSVIYRCRMDDLSIFNGAVSINTTKGAYSTENLVLALGHSARDTYRMLLSKNIFIEPKPFSIGVRIEHLREDIDKAFFKYISGILCVPLSNHRLTIMLIQNNFSIWPQFTTNFRIYI